MNKYIDAEKLKAHIEAIMEILWDRLPDADKEHPTDIELRDLGMYMALEGLVDDLDSLQQEQQEVDLEKEVRTYCGSSFKFNYDEFNDSFYSHAFEFDDVVELARHFYELGLNARKKEVDLDVDETEKDTLNKLIAKCREGRDCKAAWEFYTKAKTEEAIKEK